MIVTSTVYGIPLTEEFGEPLSNREDIHEAVSSYLEGEGKSLYDDDDYAWFISWPSAEDRQIVLGIPTDTPHKNTDWASLDKAFSEAMSKAPKNIQDMIKDINPEIVFLYGHC